MFRIEFKTAGLPVTSSGYQVDRLISRLTILPSADTLPDSSGGNDGDERVFQERMFHSMMSGDMQLVQRIRGDRWVQWFIGLSLVFNIAVWIGLWRWFPRGQNLIPLHYTIYFGINMTGPWRVAFVLPGIGVALLGIHIWIMTIIDQPQWRRMWSLLAMVLNILIAVAAIAITYLARTNSA